MLGKTISDPYFSEGGGKISGLGLLDVSTVFETEKSQIRTEGKITCSGGEYGFLNNLSFEGYEIHMGQSCIDKNTGTSAVNANINGETKIIGSVNKNVLGTYIHGFFDSNEILNSVCGLLFKRKNIDANKAVISLKDYKNMQYDKMAQTLRENVDLNKIYNIMGIKND